MRILRKPVARGGAMSWFCAVLLILLVAADCAGEQPGWLQWGGPERDFKVDTSQLADSWPDDGPKRLWHRKLGDGFSAILYDEGVLYTQYRPTKLNRYEYVIALDAVTGERVWRQRYRAPVPAAADGPGRDFTGPNATPLIVGPRLYTVGRNATLCCYQKTDGEPLWKHELAKDFGAQLEECGYSCSPIAYGDLVILPLGRHESDQSQGKSLIAFNQTTGQEVWRSCSFKLTHSSPTLINFAGRDQLVVCTKEEVLGVDPGSGTQLWRYPFPEGDFGGLYATPVWDGKEMLFFSAREVACMLNLLDVGGTTTPELRWSNRQVSLGMGTPILLGDMLVGSRFSSPPAPVAAVDVRTGGRVWLDRSFANSCVVGAGDKVILLDHDGDLGLARVTREGMTTLARHQVTEGESLTVPTLVGTTLYVRDRKHIMALDLKPDS